MKIKSVIISCSWVISSCLIYSCSPNADNAVEKLQEYGILEKDGSTTSGLSSDIMYHYKLFRDGNEPISSYPYISKLISLSREKNKKIPLSLIDEFIEAGADINTLDERGNSALLTAISGYPFDFELIDYLLNNGANSNMPGSEALAYYSTLPMFDTKVVEKLISKGANVNAKIGSAGDPLLNKIAKTGNVDFVKLLIKNGAKINEKNNQGETALISALTVLSDSEDMIETLIKSGADINTIDSTGRNPILIAVQTDSLYRTEMLIKAGADLTATYEDGKTIKDFCVSSNIKDIVTNEYWKQQVLKNSNTETKATDDVMCSYISCGIFTKGKNNPDNPHRGKTFVVKEQEKMDGNTISMRDDMFEHYVKYKLGQETLSDYPYLPVMMHLCQKYKLKPTADEVKVFIDAKADVNAQLPTEDKCLAGCYSVRNKWSAITKLLLDEGMSPHGGGADGVEHLLWIAAINEDVETCKLLLEKGSKIDAIVVNGKDSYTLMGCLLDRELPNAAEILCKLGANPNASITVKGIKMPAFALAVDRKANVSCLSTMLEHGADPNSLFNGAPLIALSIERNNEKALEQLVASKCNLNVCYTDEQFTPLMHALIRKRGEMVAMLINAGADQSIRTKSGETFKSLQEKMQRREVMNLFIDAASQSSDPQDRAAGQILKGLMN